MSRLDSTRGGAVVTRSSAGPAGAQSSAGLGLRRGGDGGGASAGAPSGVPCDDGAARAERELQDAIVNYQRTSGRMFPTWSEVLEIVQGLGYRKPVVADAIDDAR